MPFKGRAEVVPCKDWYSPSIDQSYSPFTSWKPDDCILRDVGFTIQWGDGTQGCCRPPFKTEEEAQEYVDRWNNRFGF